MLRGAVEVVRRMPRFENQTRPGQGPPSDVGADDGSECPPLKVRVLNTLDCSRGDHDVSVHEEEDGAAGATGALISGRGWTRVFRERDDGHAMRAATDGVSSVEPSSTTMISASGVIAGIVVDRNDDRDANLGAGVAAHVLPQRPPSGICHCDPLGSEGVPPALAPDQGTSQSLSGPRWPGLEY